MKFKFMNMVLTTVLLILTSVANAGLIINTDGKLTGATDILIQGEFYDVSFVDGTCENIFTGCDENIDFFWKTSTSALSASQALVEQVLNDGPLGNFDTSPELIFGCENEVLCQLSTPYNIKVIDFVEVSWINNFHDSTPLSFISEPWNGWSKDMDFSADVLRVYAKWSNATSVPEPSTLAIFSLGMIGLASRRFKKQ